MSGWIKLYRSLLKNPCNADVLGVWVYILLNVAYQPEDAVYEGKRITLQPGQGIFKIRQMAKVLGVSNSKLHRCINRFKSEKQIETQTTPRNTLISVVNWDKYQSAETQNATQMEHRWNTDETQNEFLPITNNKELKKERSNINNSYELFVTNECDEPEKTNEYQSVIDAWNSLPLNNIRAIKGKRLDMLRSRIKEYGIDDVIHAISMIRNSPFLLGQNKKGWQITIDWFLRPNNFPKVLEGNYEKTVAPVGKNDTQAGYSRMMEILEGVNNE